MKRCDIMELTPTPRAFAMQIFAAKAARDHAVELPGDDPAVAEAFDLAITQLLSERYREEPAQKETELVWSGFEAGPGMGA